MSTQDHDTALEAILELVGQLAEAGGKDPSRLSEALEETYRVVDEFLS